MSRLGAGAKEESHDERESDPRCSLLPATAGQDAGFYDHGGVNTGARHWGECRDFYAGECGHAEEPTGDRSEDAAEDWRPQRHLCGLRDERKWRLLPFLYRYLSATEKERVGVRGAGGDAGRICLPADRRTARWQLGRALGDGRVRLGQLLYFRTFGLRPRAGRLLYDADDVRGAPIVAVLSYQAWKNNYAGDPSVVGTTFWVNTKPVTIAGIAPEGFFGDRL